MALFGSFLFFYFILNRKIERQIGLSGRAFLVYSALS